MLQKIFFLICLITLTVQAQTPNYYFGNIHAHSSYSDGNKDSSSSSMTTPIQDYLYAKQSLHTDFYGISEHNHASAGNMGPYYFNKGLSDADSVNIDSVFVAMYGMEWGVISSGGHVILYGFDSLCGWDFGTKEINVAQTDYSKLWQTVNRKKGSFAYLAHPQNGDYNNLLSSALDTTADKAISGMAMRSGPAFSTNNTYSNPASSTYLSQYNLALSKGFHIGVGLDHDTHNSVFDRQSGGRLVVVAPLLNRPEIIEGIRLMHIYSSDDWNVRVNFSINNLPMGSTITNAGNPTINATVADPDLENITSITVYYGIPGSGATATQLINVSNDSLTYLHNISNNTSYYYYLYIVQADGNKIWTSPIWYNRNDSTIIQTPLSNFISSNIGCSNTAYSLQDSSINNPTSWWWSIPGAHPTNSSLQNPIVVFNLAGSYNVSLTTTNQAGVSATVTKTIVVVNPPNIAINGLQNICKGQATILTAMGGNSYLWSNASTNASITVHPIATTQYTVVGSDANCSNNTTLTLQVFQAYPSPTITQISDTLKANFSNGIQWYFNGTLIAGATQTSLLPLQTGIYSFQIKDSIGCTSDFSNQIFFQHSSIDELDAKQFFNIYPNPSKGILYIGSENPQFNIAITVMDQQGKTILNQTVQECSMQHLTTLNLTGNGNQLYFLKLVVDNKTYTTKVSVEQ